MFRFADYNSFSILTLNNNSALNFFWVFIIYKMVKNQPSKKIFKELFNLFDKYGNNLILYCHSGDSNKIACDLALKDKLTLPELELLENVKNILGKNYLDKLNKLKFTYEKYKKNGTGDIKFASANGDKFYMSIYDIMHVDNPCANLNIPMALELKDDNDSGESDESNDSDDSLDYDDISESSYAFGGKSSKAKKAKKAKKKKKKAKKILKNTSEARTAKENKKKAKKAKKAMNMTPAGQTAKAAKRKVKELKKTSGSPHEIHEAKLVAQKARHDMKMTPEGRLATETHKKAKDSYKKLKQTPEAKEFKEAKHHAKQTKKEAKAEKNTIHREDFDQESPHKLSLENVLQMGKHVVGETVRQGVEMAEDQLANTVAQTASKVITGTVSDITDRVNEQFDRPSLPQHEEIIPFLEKIFGQTTYQTKELTELANVSIQNDKKIISLLEKIYKDSTVG